MGLVTPRLQMYYDLAVFYEENNPNDTISFDEWWHLWFLPSLDFKQNMIYVEEDYKVIMCWSLINEDELIQLFDFKRLLPNYGSRTKGKYMYIDTFMHSPDWSKLECFHLLRDFHPEMRAPEKFYTQTYDKDGRPIIKIFKNPTWLPYEREEKEEEDECQPLVP